MNVNHTNEVDFDEAEAEKLITILELLEEAENRNDAVWFGEQDRREIRSIRKHIEKATGRGN
jgi:hypothetical protein